MFTQENFDSMIKWEQVQATFYLLPDGSWNYVVRNANAEERLYIDSSNVISYAHNNTPVEDPSYNVNWAIWGQRPENVFSVIKNTRYEDIEQFDLETVQDLYERLLVGIAFVRSERSGKYNPDESWPKIKKCIDWLRTTDMYTCPASTVYHDAVPGGLLKHTLRVVKRILDIASCDAFKDLVRVEDAILVAMIHDWCKIGLYDPYMRNVKNEKTGKWEQVAAYKYKDDPASCLGHGVSSMFLGQKFFNLSTEEALAVRWHMGYCRVVDSEMNELQHSNEVYPLVHLLQFADQLAIVRY